MKNIRVKFEKSLLAPYLTKFKRVLKKYILSKKPKINKKLLDKAISSLPGLKQKDKSMKLLIQLMQTTSICGVAVNIPDIALEHLSSNASLLDGLFPTKNNDGKGN